MLDDLETRWSRELQADVEVRTVTNGVALYIDGLYVVEARTLEELDRQVSLLLVFAEVDRDGF